MKRRPAPKSPLQQLIDGFLNEGECCDQPMQTGYDVMLHSCGNPDHWGVEIECYYRMCDECGTFESRTHDELAAEIEREAARW